MNSSIRRGGSSSSRCGRGRGRRRSSSSSNSSSRRRGGAGAGAGAAGGVADSSSALPFSLAISSCYHGYPILQKPSTLLFSPTLMNSPRIGSSASAGKSWLGLRRLAKSGKLGHAGISRCLEPNFEFKVDCSL